MMFRAMRFWLSLSALAGVFFTNGVKAATAGQWGCEVLLCAASSEPSWRGIAACHRPMHRLISAMARPGFSWPTCPEAGTGRPGYERYGDCPEGWSIGSSGDEAGGRRLQDICTRMAPDCGSFVGGARDCLNTQTMSRPPRSKPYYFDVADDDGTVIRHWFDLTR